MGSADVVDRRVFVNAVQGWQLLTAISYVGSWDRHRGRRQAAQVIAWCKTMASPNQRDGNRYKWIIADEGPVDHNPRVRFESCLRHPAVGRIEPAIPLAVPGSLRSYVRVPPPASGSGSGDHESATARPNALTKEKS